MNPRFYRLNLIKSSLWKHPNYDVCSKVMTRTNKKNRLKLSSFFIGIFLLKIFLNESFASTPSQRTSVDNKLSLNLKSGWRLIPGGFGFDALVAGPYKKEKRPVIGMTNLKMRTDDLKGQILNDLKSRYLESRREFINKKSGKIFHSSGPSLVMDSERKTLYRMVIKYSIKKEEFREISYILGCSSGVFHIKAMTRDEADTNFDNDIKQMIDSIVCEKI